jgi:hypothetical protein
MAGVDFHTDLVEGKLRSENLMFPDELSRMTQEESTVINSSKDGEIHSSK